jgi:FMN reductase
MSKILKVVAVSGALHKPSKTESLIEAIVSELSVALPIEVQFIKLSEIAPQLANVVNRTDLPAHIYAQIQAIESADLLVVGSPVYRASFTGLFKHFFDFVDHESLIDVPILLAATGGSERHALVIDHQLRPLFSFFQALTLPIGVYATDKDFTNYQVNNDVLQNRIELAINRALPWLLQPDPRKQAVLRQPFLAQL